ncbi:MAG: hypothetical protein U0871_15670 [Gemmataceae bacterium]
MDDAKDLQAVIAWETAVEVVNLLRWDREEQQAEAFVEILLVVQAGLERYVAARRLEFARAAGDPGRN